MGVYMQLLCLAIIASLVNAAQKKDRIQTNKECWAAGFRSCAIQKGMPDTLPVNGKVLDWIGKNVMADLTDDGVSEFWTQFETCAKKEWPEYGEAFERCKDKWTGKANEPDFDDCMKAKICT